MMTDGLGAIISQKAKDMEALEKKKKIAQVTLSPSPD